MINFLVAIFSIGITIINRITKKIIAGRDHLMNTDVLIQQSLQMDSSIYSEGTLQPNVMFQWAIHTGANNLVVSLSYHLTAATAQYRLGLAKTKSWSHWMVATKLDHLTKEFVQAYVQRQALILTGVAYVARHRSLRYIYHLLKSSLLERINHGIAKVHLSGSLNDQRVRLNLFANLNNFTGFINGNLPISEQQDPLSVRRGFQLIKHNFSAVSLARYLYIRTDAAPDDPGIRPIMR